MEMVNKVLTFYLFDCLYGIDVTLVKAMNRNPEYTVIPGAAAHIIGLLNLRGQVVTLLDMNMLLSCTPRVQRQSWRTPSEKRACVILKPRIHDPHYSGFFIHKAGDVLEIDPSLWETPPANISGAESRFLHGVVKMKTQLLRVINAQAILDSI